MVSSKEEVVMEMTELRVLDMSEDRDHHPFDMFVSIGSRTNEFLNREKVLEHLTAIDISGDDLFLCQDVCLRAYLIYQITTKEYIKIISR